MGVSERRKGIAAEREVAELLRSYGLPAKRIPNSGGLELKGDLAGVDGYHIEVKRQETLRLPTWLRQAADECGAAEPVVVFRQNRGEWYATVRLEALAELLA